MNDEDRGHSRTCVPLHFEAGARSDGRTRPEDPHDARQALLTVIADDGSEGRCLSPTEVVPPHPVNGFVRHVRIGQDPFDRARIWQDMNFDHIDASLV